MGQPGLDAVGAALVEAPSITTARVVRGLVDRSLPGRSTLCTVTARVLVTVTVTVAGAGGPVLLLLLAHLVNRAAWR